MFETEKDVLDWYESQPQVLTKEFEDSIPWSEVKDYPINPEFVPVLFYMRDVESFTEIWYRNMLRTPTGRDPVIRKFMDRWGVEEMRHGNLINRFLGEAGIPTSPRWMDEAREKIPFKYKFDDYLYSIIVNVFGKYFSGTHMVWGAINEMSTLQGYRSLWSTAGHPVLERLLRAIAQEESSHAHFYWSVAHLKLRRSKFARDMAQAIIRKYWAPVGEGTKTKSEVNYTIGKLFKGEAGIESFDRNVTRKIAKLPGFEGVKIMTDRIAQVAT